MGHYDAQYEALYAYEEQHVSRLKRGKRTISPRLLKLAEAMELLGIKGAGTIREAVEHLDLK